MLSLLREAQAKLEAVERLRGRVGDEWAILAELLGSDEPPAMNWDEPAWEGLNGRLLPRDFDRFLRENDPGWFGEFQPLARFLAAGPKRPEAAARESAEERASERARQVAWIGADPSRRAHLEMLEPSATPEERATVEAEWAAQRAASIRRNPRWAAAEVAKVVAACRRDPDRTDVTLNRLWPELRALAESQLREEAEKRAELERSREALARV